MGRWAVVWVGLGSFYLFLAGEISIVEVVASFVCTSLGTSLAFGLVVVAHRRFRCRPVLRAILRPLAALVTETFAVGGQFIAAIVRPLDRSGGFVRQPFDPGVDDDPAAAGRRAAVVLAVSLAPGSFVVRGERSDTMILHALPLRPPSPDRRWPV